MTSLTASKPNKEVTLNSITKFSSQNAREIPLDKITIDRLETIFSTTVRVNLNGEVCLLRLNPHHTGYTYLNIGGIKYPAHRITKTVAAGYNSNNLVVDHLCRNRSCVRVSHLEFVTHNENIRRGNATSLPKKYCKQGHLLEKAHQWLTPSGYVKRSCRPCHARWESNRRKRIKEKQDVNPS